MTVIFCISSAFFNLLERACCHIFLKCKDKYISFVLFLVVTGSNVFLHFVLGHKMRFVCYCCFSCVTLVSNPNYPFKLNHNKV